MPRNDTRLPKEVYLKLCLHIALFSLSGGMLAAYLMQMKSVFYVELAISLYFLSVPFLTKWIGLYPSFTISYIVLCAALIFWGIIIGPVAQIHILLAFLVGLAWYVLQHPLAKWSVVGFDIAMLFFLELAYYKEWFQPVAIPADVTMYLRWIIICVGAALSIAIMDLYHTRWTNKRVKQANYFKDLFIYQVTHDLRTHLNSIYYIAKLTKRSLARGPNKKEIEAYNELLFTAVGNASQITNNVLDIGAIEAGKMQTLQEVTLILTDFLDNLIRSQQVTAQTRGIRMLLARDPQLPRVIVTDSFKLQQILINLLNNAIKYAYKHSTVMVDVNRSIPQNWTISVTNSGAGIPADKQEAIFDSFVTNKPAITEGTGLGLYIVAKMVRVLGGTVQVKSNPNAETTFTINLPLKEGDPQDIPPQIDDLQIDLGNIRVLIADDNEMNNMLFSKYLEMSGCIVNSASNGREVLDILAHETPPDIILLDHQMPEMDGEETLLRLKKSQQLKNIPVIICTGSMEHEKSLRRAGAEAVLIKPVQQQELFKVIRQYVQ